jgi:hydrogenase maturation protease
MGDAARGGHVLVIGYGNPAREDDGLGPAVAGRIGALGLRDVEVDADYQLTVEDAERIGRADAVVLVDAAADGPAPFRFGPVAPEGGADFSTHALTAGGVVALARELFGARAPVYMLGVRGYSFRMFTERMTRPARRNARRAARFLEGRLRRGFAGGER